MLTSLHYVACMAATVGVIACAGKSAHAWEPISKEIIQKYREAGGGSLAWFRCWEGGWWGEDDNLPGEVPGFVFTEPPTGDLPAIPVPCGLTLYRNVFYSIKGQGGKPTGTDLMAFWHLENLTDLKLELGGPADKKIISQIQQFKKLKHLQLSGRVTDDDMDNLVALKSLESLELGPTLVTDKGIAKLSALEKLKALDLGKSGVRGTGFERHQEFKNLSILILSYRVNDEGLACVSRLEKLERLRIYGGRADCTDAGTSKLGNLRNLKLLVLPCHDMSDVGLRAISRNKGLRHLDVHSAKITDDGLRLLANLRELRSLDLSLCRQLTDLRPLSKLEELRTLELTYCEGLTDSSFEEIGKLQQLSYLWMPRVPITDAAVKHIAKLKNLKTLSLWGTEVTDECIDDLATMKSLRDLYLGRTKISQNGIERLRELLPKCEI